ncbi:hypothetical protein PoMZ_04206 [Pyricularia oryzae]|uniref:Uncharacterized protein n=1 Tax=Pyricularia oryzae TaxID=318829 RepID=A0A4V1C6A9_PYROR|nr:hypothetical protein PoMZ_04206 [Pyricularia oryzae]
MPMSLSPNPATFCNHDNLSLPPSISLVPTTISHGGIDLDLTCGSHLPVLFEHPDPRDVAFGPDALPAARVTVRSGQLFLPILSHTTPRPSVPLWFSSSHDSHAAASLKSSVGGGGGGGGGGDAAAAAGAVRFGGDAAAIVAASAFAFAEAAVTAFGLVCRVARGIWAMRKNTRKLDCFTVNPKGPV